MTVTNALLTLLVLGAACVQRGSDLPAQQPSPKLDPGMRRLLAGPTPPPPDSVVGVFIRLERPPGESERAALEHAGARIGTITGPLLTARVAVADVSAVAALQFVRYIELSRRLDPQGAHEGRSGPSASDGNP